MRENRSFDEWSAEQVARVAELRNAERRLHELLPDTPTTKRALQELDDAIWQVRARQINAMARHMRRNHIPYANFCAC